MQSLQHSWRPLAMLSTLVVAAPIATASAGGPMVGVAPIANAAREAVARVRSFVVQVQPIGVAENAPALDTLGPTTGVYLAEHGCVLTSSYRVVDAAGLLVFFDGGDRSAAELVATDNHRKVALLRLTSPPQAPPGGTLAAAPRKGLRVGQTTIAVGRVHRVDEPNIALGILSAERRLLGLAAQTDANVSPANYGGPLIDLQGRVIGLLTPLAPSSGGAPGGGAGWYDSGIGFAVPWGDIDARLPRLLAGEDLHRGRLGLTLKPGNPHRTAPEIAALKAGGPAESAGLQIGDRIMAANSVATPSNMAFRFVAGVLDAGAKIEVVVQRGEDRLTFSLELTAELPEAQPADAPEVEGNTIKSIDAT